MATALTETTTAPPLTRREVTVPRRKLSRAIALASCGMPKITNIPVLRSLRATANGTFALEGTDLDTFSRVEMPYEGSPQRMLLPEPARLRVAIDAAGHEQVALSHEGDRLDLTCGALEAHLATLSVDDFPTPDHPAAELFAVDLGAAALQQLARLVPAISSEETRYYLNGICVHKVGDWTWQFAATDGHRLHIVDIPLPGAVGDLPQDVILPRRFVTLALQHFRKAAGPVRLTFGPRALSNEAPPTLDLPISAMRIALAADLDGLRFTLASKLIDGTYPDYPRVIPPAPDRRARVDRAELVQAIHALSAFSSGKWAALKLAFAPGEVIVSRSDATMGEAAMRVPAQHDLEPGLHSGFNGNYLCDALAALKGGEVTFHFTRSEFITGEDKPRSAYKVGGNSGPVLITDPEDTDFRIVLMPLRL